MLLPIRANRAIALALCMVAALSLIQTGGIMSGIASADNGLTLQLARTATSTESPSAVGTVQINLENGRTTIEIHEATPLSVYTALFVSASSSAAVQFGTFVTDSGGEGGIQVTLDSGTYVGVFEVARLTVVQFASASASFTIATSVSASTSATVSSTSTNETETSTSQTRSENTISVTNSAQFAFQVEPASRSISAGGLAKFEIRIAHIPSANVFLVARDPPHGSIALFTPNTGVANPEFHSTLTIVTSAQTPAGTYAVTIVASVDGREFTSQVNLQVSASSSGRVTVSVSAALSMSVVTDQSQYKPNSTVIVRGHVTDDSGSAVADATVSVQVDSPTGTQVFYDGSVQTDPFGTFTAQFALSADAAVGTYTVFGSASKSGFSGVVARATFVVGTSSTPSVIISAVYTGDGSGNPLSSFSVGQTVFIWVVVQNIGVTFQGVIWVQVRDPNGVPVEIRITIANLHAGETVKDGIGFTVSNNSTLGVYHVDALVSDRLISQGGTFLANAQTQFALVS